MTALVQEKAAPQLTQPNYASTMAVFDAPVTAGNLIVACCQVRDPSSTVVLVGDSRSDTFLLANSPIANGDGELLIYYAPAGATGSLSVTLSLVSGYAGSTSFAMHCFEFSGCDGTVQAAQTASGAAANPSLNLTGLSSGGVIVAMMISNGGGVSAGSGFTLGSGPANQMNFDNQEYQVNAPGGTVPVAFSVASGNYIIAAAAFKATALSRRSMLTLGVG